MATDLIETKEFAALAKAELQAFAQQRANAVGLEVPDAYFSGVLQDLAALQAHAAIFATRLEADPSSHPDGR